MINKVMGYRLWVTGLVIFSTFAQVGCYAQSIGNLLDKEIELDKELELEDPYTWDFGQVEEGEVLKHDFVLKNESQNILNIKALNTSCGCTVSEVKQKVVLPGESALIEVKFNSKGYSGSVQQFIYVHTDNLDNPIIRYIIKAEVVKGG